MKRDLKSRKKIKKRISKSKVRSFFEANDFNMVEVLSIVIVSIIFGVMVGCFLTYKRSPVTGREIPATLDEFISVYSNIKSNYYDEVDDEELLNAAISGMVGSLDDPYSLYMDDKDTSDFNQSVDGSYVGIGASIYMNDDANNKIAEIYSGGGADKAGLKVDDAIIEIDGKDVTNIHGEELVALIKGKENTTIEMKVLRGNDLLTFKVKRTVIELTSATSSIIEEGNKKIGLIILTNFAANTGKQFKKEMKKIDGKIDSLIIDVRDNPGGHLSQVADILDVFFDNKTVLYQLETKGKKKKIYAEDSAKKKYPVVILADSGSASASEILISCFKENYKDATVVGNLTYGKGTVQKALGLSNGSSIKYTSQKWLTSKGKWINEKGIQPDVEVEQSEDYYTNPTQQNDTQLKKAIEILKDK